jgi:hypothetical protein
VSDGYALCPNDRFWFRPAYTEGRCPLCGEVAPGGEPPLPLLLRLDGFSLGLVLVALVSLGMSALVLAMYFQA